MSLGLLGAYESGSEDSESEQSEEEIQSDSRTTEPPEEALDNPFGGDGAKPCLPKPSFMQEQQGKITGLRLDTSVFSNPFRDKEDKKKAILEQHVNMTQRQEEMKMIDGKKVCWMYRKGRCRQGSRCKFAHDNDVKTDKAKEMPKYDEESQITNDKAKYGAMEQLRNIPLNEESSQEVTDAVVRKKRPGLSQGIVPSKKAMKFHKKVYS